MSEWQPIETCPADVSKALLFGELDGEVSGPQGKKRAVGERPFGAQWFLTGTDCYTVQITPTHWMPLPNPPKSTP